MDNPIIITLKDGTTLEANTVTEDVIGVISNDPSDASRFVTLGNTGGFSEYTATVDGKEIKAPASNKFIGISVTANDDGSFYYVISFLQKSETDLLHEQIEALMAENEELRQTSEENAEYAEVGRILLGEEVEEDE